ncbi:MAG: monovalent cation/H+ antiporter subunit D family protein [Gammaproteobacteria bacterium]|nr:monovalent cation/H+ antiporter subunit D family protein [Gammaproteobacteria bacterium]
MEDHFPVLVVLVPLMAAPLVVIAANGAFGCAMAFIASCLSLAMSLSMLGQVTDGAMAISYALGDWVAPWGIEYRVDRLNALVLALVSGISAVVLLFAWRTAPRNVASDRLYLFYACWLLCLTGLLGIAVTGDAFNVFVFLEISSLSTYTLVSLAKRRSAQWAAFRYLIMGTVGATFILIGVGLLYMMTGTLNMADLAQRLPPIAHTAAVRAGVGFILVGVAAKMALFPLHMWLPHAYTQAPIAVSAFLAGTATKVAAYLMMRFALSVFGAAYSFDTLAIGTPIVLAGCGAALVGSLAALQVDDVKRLLAYSSLAQIGYIALGIGIGSITGVAAGILHVFNHALMKTALFTALGCVLWQCGSQTLQAFNGLGRRMPLTALAWSVAAASLIGIPLTAGFISKWYLILGALERGWWPLAVLVLVTSLMAVVYMGKVLERIWLGPAVEWGRERGAAVAKPVPASMLAATLLLAGANIYFGIDTDLTVDVALSAATALLAGYAP